MKKGDQVFVDNHPCTVVKVLRVAGVKRVVVKWDTWADRPNIGFDRIELDGVPPYWRWTRGHSTVGPQYQLMSADEHEKSKASILVRNCLDSLKRIEQNPRTTVEEKRVMYDVMVGLIRRYETGSLEVPAEAVS